ncbi:MAG: hypothetical protein EA425_14295 [Puniceicoccaceae bacterium]|nr:MAG: hypothetical protein EA425_14295 [Puniceicoccaceae bacterium]
MLQIIDADGNVVFQVNPDGTSFHAGRETFADGITVRGETTIGPRQPVDPGGSPDDTLQRWSLGVAGANAPPDFFGPGSDPYYNIPIEVLGLSIHSVGPVLLTREDIDPGFLDTITGFDTSFGLMVEAPAYFHSDVFVQGGLFAEMKHFQIDHPLYPETHYLRHASVESAEMLTLYTGNAVVAADGTVWVELPGWFEALNTDFRYQLTGIGAAAPLYIAEEIRDNRFRIAGGEPGMTVSWQVTAVRHDDYARAHPLVVEAPRTGAAVPVRQRRGGESKSVPAVVPARLTPGDRSGVSAETAALEQRLRDREAEVSHLRRQLADLRALETDHRQLEDRLARLERLIAGEQATAMLASEGSRP